MEDLYWPSPRLPPIARTPQSLLYGHGAVADVMAAFIHNASPESGLLEKGYWFGSLNPISAQYISELMWNMDGSEETSESQPVMQYPDVAPRKLSTLFSHP